MSTRRRRRSIRVAAVVGALTIAVALVVVVLVVRGAGEPVVRQIAIDGRPSAVAVAAGLVWVADDEGHVVHVIDPARNAVVGEPIDVDRNPIAIAGDDRAVWVAHGTGSVVRIDADSRRAGPPVDVGGSLTGIAVSARRAWAADIERSELVEIDPRGVEVLDRVEVSDGVVRVALAGDDVWVTGQEDVVTRVAGRTKRVRATVRVGNGPIGLAYDGELLWVANSDDDTVSAVDTSGNGFVDSVGVGRGPVAVGTGGDVVWVANQDDATLSRVDRRRRAIVGPPIELGTHPRGLAAAGGAVWVAGTNSNLLVRVDF